MNTNNKGPFTAAIAIAMLIGAVGGGALLSNSKVNAQAATSNQTAATTSTTAVAPATADTNSTVKSGTFKSNEDPTHEAGESAAREAQENAGQRPTAQ